MDFIRILGHYRIKNLPQGKSHVGVQTDSALDPLATLAKGRSKITLTCFV